MAFFSIERSYTALSESVRTIIPHNIDKGKRSITLLFLYSLHLSVIIGGALLLRIFIYIYPFYGECLLKIYEKISRIIYIFKIIFDLYIKNVIKYFIVGKFKFILAVFDGYSY